MSFGRIPILVLLALQVSSCRRPPDGVAETVDFAGPRARIRVLPGRAWTTPFSASIPVAGDGTFRAPAGARLLDAFLDLNGNGTLDRPDEPSGRCVRGDHWRCQIQPVRLTIHRLQGVEESGAEVDSTVAVAEVFDVKAGGLDRSTMICDPTTSRCVGSGKQGLYLDGAPSVVFPLVAPSCGIAGNQFPRGGMVLEMSASSMAKRRFVVQVPDPLGMKVSVARASGGVSLVATTSRPVERVLLWLGADETENAVDGGLTWSSESPGARLDIGAGGFSGSVPAAVLAGCQGKCRIHVQAAVLTVNGEVTSVSEVRDSVQVPS